jgi:phosphorylcholine metabolism protein LicD
MDIIIIFNNFEIIDSNTISYLKAVKQYGSNIQKTLILCYDKSKHYLYELLSSINIIDFVFPADDSKYNLIQRYNANIYITSDLNEVNNDNLQQICNVIYYTYSNTNNEQFTLVQQILLKEKDAIELYSLMNIIHTLLTNENIEYFPVGGTLLGAIRNFGLIPWDFDLDICIMEKDIPKLHNQNCLNYLNNNNCSILKTSTCFYIKYKSISIDIFPWNKKTHNTYGFAFPTAAKIWSKRIFYHNDLYPLKKYNFGPIQILGPNNPHNYLIACKFENYMVEGILGLSWHREKYQNIINILKKKKLHKITNKELLYKQYNITLNQLYKVELV